MTMPKPNHCAECRDLFDEVRDAGLRLARLKPFAHAHHVITAEIARARVAYLTVAGIYGVHKGQCPLRKTRKQAAA
jgi:hypothetical protein